MRTSTANDPHTRNDMSLQKYHDNQKQREKKHRTATRKVHEHFVYVSCYFRFCSCQQKKRPFLSCHFQPRASTQYLWLWAAYISCWRRVSLSLSRAAYSSVIPLPHPLSLPCLALFVIISSVFLFTHSSFSSSSCSPSHPSSPWSSSSSGSSRVPQGFCGGIVCRSRLCSLEPVASLSDALYRRL